MKKCLIFLEKQYEEFVPELIGAAEKMYRDDFFVTAVSVDGDHRKIIGIVDEIIDISSMDISVYDLRAMTETVKDICRQEKYDSILILATHLGRMLAPSLAMGMGVGLVADVTDIQQTEGGEPLMVRPAFSGKLMACIRKVGAGPCMMSIRPGIFTEGKTAARETRIISYSGKSVERSGIRLIRQTRKPDTEDIRDYEVLVSGGGGILQNFDQIDELANRLGGKKAASRKVVDSKKADRSIQVGQSGKVVHPNLYIALGIYGAVQHVAGLRKVRHIIAVNTNSSAPICSLANIVVEGDAAEFVKLLSERIDKK